MIDKNFTDKLRKSINEDAPELPESLSADNISSLVKGTEQKSNNSRILKMVAMAAMLALVVTGSVVGIKHYNSAPVKEAEHKDEIVYTESYENIEKLFISLRNKLKENKNDVYYGLNFGASTDYADTAANPSSSTASSSSGASSSSAVDISKTDLQVAGVDEDDLVKNDGKYLYTVGKYSDINTVRIIDIGNPSELKLASEIKLNDDDFIYSVLGLYLTGDKLTVIYSQASRKYRDVYNSVDDICYGVSSDSKIGVAIYDISDRTSPKMLKMYGIDGTFVSSRLTNGELTVVSSYIVPMLNDDAKLKENCIPKLYYDDCSSRVPAESINILNCDDCNSYTVIMKISLDDLSKPAKTSAVLGNTSMMYSNGKRLYLSGWRYEDNSQKTEIFVFDIENGICFKGTCKVDGQLLNQYSMDEYDGYFRVASCDYNQESRITVFDSDLKVVSTLGDIGKYESIYAVRFMGDTAYVVTFRTTDPLFVIDLSDPTAPKITGELKIPGYSTMLFPFENNLLVGIGMENRSLKISLFDISDKASPKEIDKIVFESEFSCSEASNDHKAFTRFGNTNEFAIPVDDGNRDCIYLFKITGSSLVKEKVYEYSYDGILSRAAYAGNTIFAVGDNAIVSYDKNSEKQLSVIDYDNIRRTEGGREEVAVCYAY